MAVLVTGATGFLGAQLCEDLLLKNEEVIAIGRKSIVDGKAGFINKTILSSKNFHYIQSDLNELKADQLKHFKISIVFHLAFIVERAGNSKYNYDDYYNSSIMASINVIRLIKELEIKKVIYVSTLSVIGPLPSFNSVIDENTPVSPIDNYGLAKYTVEKLFEFAVLENNGFSCITIRFPLIFGVNNSSGIVHYFKESALLDKDIELFGEGKYLRSAMYVKDASHLLVSILRYESSLGFYVFCVGSLNSLTTKEIADKVIQLLSSNSKVILSKKQSLNPHGVIINLEFLKEKIGFVPIRLEEGLRLYIDDIKEDLNV